MWHDTTRGLPWLKEIPSISPGRWAVGYNYLYVMTRILNDIQPRSILELGLGASTTLISQYINYFYKSGNGTYSHMIAEHDEAWIDFYTKSHELNPSSIIIKQDIVKMSSVGEYNAYKNLEKDIKGKKFSVISVDAPIGTDSAYSRRDILEFIPDILEESFVIVIDDANREGEKNTIKEIEMILKRNHIIYGIHFYTGETDCCVITSEDNIFICSL